MPIKFKKTTSPARRRAIKKMIMARKGKKLGGKPMKKRTTRRPAASKGKSVTYTSRIVNRRLSGSYNTELKELGKVTGGALLATWLINIVPKVNEFSPLMKGAVMIAVGIILGKRTKKKFQKQLLAGTTLAGALTASLPLLQKFAPDAKLSGGRALTNAEVQALLGAPINLANNGMSAPINFADNGMSAPIDLSHEMGYSDSYYTY